MFYLSILFFLCFCRHTCFAYSSNLAASPIRLTAKSTIDVSPTRLHRFLASPANWPTIVLSSQSVERVVPGTDLSHPFEVGDEVRELFGLPPIFPLSVTWRCVASEPPNPATSDDALGTASRGALEFVASEGVPGIASACVMRFTLRDSGCGGSDVVLHMEYRPESFVSVLAVPALVADNALALKVLLPAALRPVRSRRETFLRLMGTLYFFAGVAHLWDCLWGGSQLLLAAGSPSSFWDLPGDGQWLAVIWCAAGPLSFFFDQNEFYCRQILGRSGTLGLWFCGGVVCHFAASVCVIICR
mmetsp:Transcript_43060/g.101013  ORF Transcript_43060/g.101013 Transcript_43060/m.101013 type:complete len:301 (+) Transcript_43060:72-974(+)